MHHWQEINTLRSTAVRLVSHLAQVPSSAAHFKDVLLSMPAAYRQQLQVSFPFYFFVYNIHVHYKKSEVILFVKIKMDITMIVGCSCYWRLKTGIFWRCSRSKITLFYRSFPKIVFSNVIPFPFFRGSSVRLWHKSILQQRWSPQLHH